MPYYLAVDVGGTKTEYVLADETRELARVRGGCIKLMRTDAESATANLDQSLQQLVKAADVPLQAIQSTCIGAAGNTVPLVAEWLRAAFTTRVGGRLLIVNDVEIALDAAFSGAPGVLVLAGTGSNVAGRDHHGSIITAGGWGPAVADQGSGHRIGLEAVRAAFLALGEQRPTRMLDAICDFWQLSSIDSLVAFANTNPPPDFSRLTSMVLDLARQGDSVALQVLRKEGRELGYLATLVMRRIQASGTLSLPAMAFAGSIPESIQPVRDAIIDRVREDYPLIEVRGGVVDPLAGAVWRARNL